MNFETQMKIFLYRKYFNIILLGDEALSLQQRAFYMGKSLITLAPIAFLMDMLNVWFFDNQLFFTTVVAFVFLNMILGAYMHRKNGTFDWFILIKKTMTMIIATMLTYFVLELILMVAGSNIVTETFRTTIQVATLLYPGSKILKNIFILSDGEHPPKWVMQKIYNFQNDGDLSAFMDNKNNPQSPIVDEGVSDL
jgi:hypothetical protein